VSGFFLVVKLANNSEKALPIQFQIYQAIETMQYFYL